VETRLSRSSVDGAEPLTPLPTFYRLIGQHRHSFPATTAIVYRGQRFTFGDLYERTNRIANGLASLGVGEGDRILWLGQNAHRLVELLFACSRLGAALCVSNWRQSVSELRFIVEDFDAKVIFWQEEEVGDVLREVRASTRSQGAWLVHDGAGDGSYEGLLARSSADAGREAVSQPHQRALLVLYTAAFDGSPNGAQLSEIGLYLQSLVHIAALEIKPANVALVSTPLFHIVAWLDFLPTFMLGGKAVIARRTKARELLELIHNERACTGRVQAPTARQIAELNQDGKYDLSCFRSSLAIPGWTEMTRRGPDMGGAGQTEVAGPIVIGAYSGQGSTPFCGRIAPIAEARIVDEDGREVAPGELGELLIRGPVTGLGYWNRPALNGERLSNGWWKTSDLVRRDPDGTISFVAPKLQLIKSGAENVYPAEVEAVIRSHPGISNAAIIGVPDPQWTQLVTAIVVRVPGASVEAGDVIQYVRERIAHYKAPRRVHFTDELPMRGQVPDYRALDVRFGGGNYPGQRRVSTVPATEDRRA
jgi:acyl-CoA synthetase (AMP-forming)/AMP-acid ligase II